ncbi:helix-turn-helix transcriptional regulator [Deinococcus sp. KSM4-11]|uniref:helix-turn-helix transcriptional regulator n=1 Tax=Deinococcus sp. KSM4-11 TaxID=2568654 RepID=UPI0010A2F8C6|nr:helix-turn-helix transcriptional regulator [Deinococcus sp. KSM4-11]THF85500.1 helix-turn-helix transcriptional regulator [Deinococcus sp. KSM4-11]
MVRRPRKVHPPTTEDLAFRLALGQRIRALRVSDYSQDEFADAIDVFRSHMSAIERGKTDLKLSTLRRIASALNLPVDELLRLESTE